MTYVPANDNRDLWAIVGAMLAALLGAGWSSRRREHAPNGSTGAPGDESALPDDGGREAPPREAGD